MTLDKSEVSPKVSLISEGDNYLLMTLAARHTVTLSWVQSLESTTVLVLEKGVTSPLNFISQRLLINWIPGRAAL